MASRVAATRIHIEGHSYLTVWVPCGNIAIIVNNPLHEDHLIGLVDVLQHVLGIQVDHQVGSTNLRLDLESGCFVVICLVTLFKISIKVDKGGRILVAVGIEVEIQVDKSRAGSQVHWVALDNIRTQLDGNGYITGSGIAIIDPVYPQRVVMAGARRCVVNIVVIESLNVEVIVSISTDRCQYHQAG